MRYKFVIYMTMLFSNAAQAQIQATQGTLESFEYNNKITISYDNGTCDWDNVRGGQCRVQGQKTFTTSRSIFICVNGQRKSVTPTAIANLIGKPVTIYSEAVAIRRNFQSGSTIENYVPNANAAATEILDGITMNKNGSLTDGFFHNCR